MDTPGIHHVLRPAPVLPNRKNSGEQAREQKRLDIEKRRRADEMARRALRLAPQDPTPQPELSPELQQALASLGEEDLAMVKAVVGCTQELTRRIGMAQKAAEDQAGAGQQASQRMSLAQLLIIRRANDGTLTEYDVERARSSVDARGAQAWVDPVAAGAGAFFQQAQEMLAANQTLVSHLRMTKGAGQDPAVDFITKHVNSQAATLSQASNNYQVQFHMDDMARLRQIAQYGLELRRVAGVNGIGRP